MVIEYEYQRVGARVQTPLGTLSRSYTTGSSLVIDSPIPMPNYNEYQELVEQWWGACTPEQKVALFPDWTPLPTQPPMAFEILPTTYRADTELFALLRRNPKLKEFVVTRVDKQYVNLYGDGVGTIVTWHDWSRYIQRNTDR